MTVVIFLIILAILILSHEFGHFIVAKKSGIRVDEFGLGFPPKLFGWKRGETEYSLNILPLGGFVKIFGENPDEESISGPDASRSLVTKPKHIQAAVLVAGVACNLILAWLLISVGFMVGLPTPVDQIVASDKSTAAHLLITTVAPNSPALAAGLKSGDELMAIKVAAKPEVSTVANPTPELIRQFIEQNGKEKLLLEYRRGKIFKNSNVPVQTVELQPVIGLVGDKLAIGIGMDLIANVSKSFFPALWQGLLLTGRLAYLTVTSLIGLIGQAFMGESVLSNITGPVGLVGLVGDASNLGFIYLLSFTAFISINLAVVNLVPFPALDGGRLLFLLIEKIKGSAINPKVANTLNLVGFGLLLLFMAVVTYGDLIKLFWK
jgi:regulator of sigma E protease